MTTPDEFRIASPPEIAEAWHMGVMQGRDRSYAREEISAYPIGDLIDPTYHRGSHEENNGWHRARDISSMSAQSTLKGYLFDRGLTLPREVIDAWAVTNEHRQWAAEILSETNTALEMNLAGARSRGDLADLVLDALKEYRFTLGDLA